MCDSINYNIYGEIENFEIFGESTILRFSRIVVFFLNIYVDDFLKSITIYIYVDK